MKRDSLRKLILYLKLKVVNSIDIKLHLVYYVNIKEDIIMNEIVGFIQSVGFPIVAFILLYIYINKKDQQQQEERKLFREAIDNNTKAILSLESKLVGKENNNG